MAKGGRSSDAARKAQREAVAASDRRAARVTSLAIEAAWRAVSAALTDEALDGVEWGNTTAMTGGVRNIPITAVKHVVGQAQREAWEAGLREGRSRLVEVFGEEFEEPKRRRPSYRPTPSEKRQAREQARAFLRSFERALRDQVAEDMHEARGTEKREQSWQAQRVALSRLRVGDTKSPEARRFMARVEARAKLDAPMRDVDWEVARRGEVQSIRDSGKVVLVEFVATNDDATTPACAFLDGALLLSTDPRIATYTPGLHYRCRSMFVARAGKRSQASWDRVATKTIGEPSAGSPHKRTYRLKPSQIRIPAGAPNVPPPDTLSEWA